MLLMTFLVVHVRSRVMIGTYLFVMYQLLLHAKYQGSRPGGFRQEHFLYVFTICKAMSKESLTRRCHTNTLHTNPLHREEESKNNNSLINYDDAILTTVHYLNKLGRVPLGDATYQILRLLVSDKNVF